MATANKVPLKTLKECFQFLEWLRSNGGMQGLVADELVTRLSDKYINLDKDKIGKALSEFLDLVSRFYKKLVTEKVLQKAKETANTKYDESVTLVVFKALIECIPKVLSACYFLQYHVDGNFKTLGGGEWAGDMVGRIAHSGAGLGKIYSYLLITSGNSFRVIPGGFVQGELNEGDQNGDDQNGYKHGNVMADDLGKILDQRKDNLFLDVFVTSVSSTAGSQASNTANVLALLWKFCDILERGEYENLDGPTQVDISGTGNCIPWDQLKPHCSELKTQLDKLFAKGVFSYTGQLPKDGDHNKAELAKRMARWLKDNLDKVRGKLHYINKHSHILDNIQTNQLGDYLNNYFFPYGFTFYGHDVLTENTLSQVLKDDWKAVIKILDEHDYGLAKLVNILKDMKCTESQKSQKAGFEDDEKDDYDEVVVEEEEDGSAGSSNQNDVQSGHQPAIPPASLGSETPLPDGKESISAPAGTPSSGDAGLMSPQVAALTQKVNVSDPQSVASGVLSTGSDPNFSDIKLHIELPPRNDAGDDDQITVDASLANRVNSLRYPKGMYPPKYPLTRPHTSGKARTQSDRISYQDTLQDMSDSPDSLDPYDANGSFKHFDFTIAPYDGFAGDSYIPSCQNPWYVELSSITNTSVTPSSPPGSAHVLSPQTVREMLYWFVGLNQLGYIGFITDYVKRVILESNKDVSKLSDDFEVTGNLSMLDASMVAAKLAEACLYSASVLCRVKYCDDYKAYLNLNFEMEYSQLHYASDPACLICQLRDYVYACCHQLQFLKAQCNRDKLNGGWKGQEYGSAVSPSDSSLQSFLTDTSNYNTYFYNPCNICLKSRIKIGFKKDDFYESPKDGSYLYYLLSPTCSVDDDPLLTLSSYLNCLTRRTPRTTGELVSFFHNFGNSLHDAFYGKLLPLGTALSTPHSDCPEWGCFRGTDLQAVRGIRGTDPFNTIHDNDIAHPNSLSTLVGCSGDRANCPQHCSPITYRAYALYSPAFAHTYLSWAVYLPDRLWESLDRLSHDLEGHVSDKCSSLHQCDKAMTLLYTHGFTPPEGTPRSSITCSELITKLGEVVYGKPIAKLMTCMDGFLYKVRMPFIYTLIALWSVAALLLSYTILYRLDILYLCSHAIRSKASHLIDVKALLTNSRKMLSLYDADYFDDDPNDLIDQLN